jgi:PD-(D/E)XK nuclease superfamily protein
VGCETKRKGDACETHVLAALVAAGLTVLVPWGDNAAYDLVVDLEARFLRVQCKTARPIGNGCISFNTYRVGRALDPVALPAGQMGRVRWAARYAAPVVIEAWRITQGALAPNGTLA